MSASKLHSEVLRYTHLPALLHMLKTRTITLLDPDTWEDRNDARYLAIFKEKSGLQAVHALCMTQVPETFHHWKVFAPGSAGVCIYFRRKRFLESMSDSGVEWREVDYLTIKEARAFSFRTEDLPYLKRAGYRPEGELRLLHSSTADPSPVHDVPLSVDLISKVSLSPWLPLALSEAVKVAICKAEGCSKLKVTRSTLISNAEWQSLGASAT